MKHPYIKHNRRTDTYSVYAWINGSRKVVARVKNEIQAINLMDQAKAGSINTTRYPNTRVDPIISKSPTTDNTQTARPDKSNHLISKLQD